MAIVSDQPSAWGDIELPCVLRYRRNAFVAPLLSCALLVLMALVCTYWSGKWFAGLPFAVLAVATLTLTFNPLRHVRSIDCMLVDREALTLHGTDGTELRISFKPGAEFLVRYDYFYRSIIYATAANDYRDAQHVMIDVLDVPRGHDIYDLCRLMNDLSTGDLRAGRRATPQTRDWYRDPPRLTRPIFALGCAGIVVLFLCTLVALNLLASPLAGLLAWPMLSGLKLGLGALFIYPAYRFLAIGRLRDLGEAATHRNVDALVWRTAAGPVRLFVAPGTLGRNAFGSEPRF